MWKHKNWSMESIVTGKSGGSSYEFKRTNIKKVVVKEKNISWKEQIMTSVYDGIKMEKTKKKSKEAEILSFDD